MLVAVDKRSQQSAFPPPEFPISAHTAEHVRVIERLNSVGAKLIVMDSLFDQINPDLDLEPFVDALDSAGTVCLAAAVERRTIGIESDGTAIMEERLVISEERIRAYMEANCHKMPDEFNRGIVREAQRFCGSEHLDDDITLLTLRIV